MMKHQFLPRPCRTHLPTADRRRRLRAAFTLLEMMLVIALIGMLVAVGVTNFDKIFGDAQRNTAQIFTALTNYRLNMGNYPTTAQGLQALVTAPDGGSSRWSGPYMDAKGGKILEDPWGKPYQYRYPGTKNPTGYDLFSLGKDGQEGTSDDVTNW